MKGEKALSSALIALIFVAITITFSITAFLIYGSLSTQSYNSSYATKYVSEVEANTKIAVSPLSFKLLRGNTLQNAQYYVNFLLFVQLPYKGAIYAVPFVTYSTSSPYTAVPIAFNASIQQLPKVTFNNVYIYLPQGNNIGPLTLVAYNLTSSITTLNVTAKVKPGEIIVVWILIYYEGRLYRIVYPYVNPFTGIVGTYVTGRGGVYVIPGQISAAIVPVSNVGNMVGIWFYTLSNSTAIILNMSVPVTSTSVGKLLIMVRYAYNELYLNITTNLGSSVNKIGTLSINNWYYMNLSFGSQTQGGSGFLNYSIYTQNGNLFAKGQSTIPTGINSKGQLNVSILPKNNYAVAVSQFFFTDLQSNTGLTPFYNMSTQLLKNGYLYNNTLNVKWIMQNSVNQLYYAAYLYAVSTTTPPPQYLYTYLFYWANGQLQEKAIPSSTQVSWIFI